MKCQRTACENDADERLIHRDTGGTYCPPCARKINELSGQELVPFPSTQSPGMRALDHLDGLRQVWTDDESRKHAAAIIDRETGVTAAIVERAEEHANMKCTMETAIERLRIANENRVQLAEALEMAIACYNTHMASEHVSQIESALAAYRKGKQ